MIARALRILSLTLACHALAGAGARAGGGPERTLVVVNARSVLSLEVAHRYVELRGIPERHVLYLTEIPDGWVPGHVALGLADLQNTILWPIADFLKAQELEAEIDVVTFSTGFPYCVNISDLALELGLPPVMTPTLSLTGATYFLRQMEQGKPDFLSLMANQYFRGGLPYESRPLRSMTGAERILHDRSVALYMSKEYESSAAGFQELVASYRDDPLVWYNYACDLALLGRDEAALEALQKAVAAGWSDAAHTAQDPDLQGLRTSIRGAEALRELFAVMETRESIRYPAHAFRSSYLWAPAALPERASIWDAMLSVNGGYLLSTCLGYIGVRGNSVPEVLRCLENSRAIDGQQPQGTFYMMRSSNLRTKARELLFASATQELRERGLAAEVLSHSTAGQTGDLPMGRTDILGILSGVEEFDWSLAGSTIRPGALCENLTNYGGAFWKAEQSKLSEFIRHGAAGASGPVAEPFAIAAKFPTPRLFLYYAQGCSLAEAYYQAVASPYQLLVVGDPLTRPFARPGTVAITPPPASDPVSGVLQFTPTAALPGGGTMRQFELWVDGQVLAEVGPGEVLPWDTTRVQDGPHEVRLVGVEDSDIETRAALVFTADVLNHGHHLRLGGPQETVTLGQEVPLHGIASGGAAQVEVFLGARLLQQFESSGPEFDVSLDSTRLGLGRCQIRARATFLESGGVVWSAPVTVQVASPAALPPLAEAQYSLPGLAATLKSSASGKELDRFLVTSLEPAVATVLSDRHGLLKETSSPLQMSGELEVMSSGYFELIAYSSSAAEVTIGGHSVLRCAGLEGSVTTMGGIALEQGWHSLEVHFPQHQPGGFFYLFASGADPGAFPTAPHLRTVLDYQRQLDEVPAVALRRGAGDEKLFDGARNGASQPIPWGELEFQWDRSQRKISSLVLYLAAPAGDTDDAAAPPADAAAAAPARPPFPTRWIVEKKSGRSWEKVGGVEVRLGFDPARGPLAEATPAYVWLDFSPQNLREMRVRPEAAAVDFVLELTEVEVLVRGLRKR